MVIFLRTGTAILTGVPQGSERAWGKETDREREEKTKEKETTRRATPPPLEMS
jgi:hypothetical protein